jgi:hypothetical protein
MITAIQSILQQYIQNVSTTYNIPVNNLQDLMDKFPNTATGNILRPVVAVVPQPVPAIIGVNTCQYVYVKGQKAGTSCSHKSKKDSEFCSQHSKKKEEPQIVVVETAKEAPKKSNPVLRMNKIINKWWHPETGLVFKSSEEKIVIGIFKDESIHDLTEQDVATCVTHKFKYVFNKRKKEDDDEDEKPMVKKQKTIDTAFIKINQEAKNVEVLIKEMFNKNVEEEDDDDDDEEEVTEERSPFYHDDGGVAESKTCYQDDDDDEPPVEDEEDIEEEELLEEED